MVIFLAGLQGVSEELYDAAKVDGSQVEALIAARLAARKAKNFKEADRVRDQLAGMGVQLKDAKDPTSGEIVTTWEVKR